MLNIQEYHSFKIELASMILPDGKMVGTDNAIFLQDIAYWCDYNKSSGTNFYDGRYWTYSTMDSICKRHPYWTKSQVRRIIDKCKEYGFLLVGNYNKSSYDRTIWYSVSDKILEILGSSNLENANAEISKWKCEDKLIENDISSNGIENINRPIPNNKKDNNTDTKQIFNSFLEYGFSEELIRAVKDWIIYKKEKRDNYTPTSLKSFLSQIRTYTNEYGEEEMIETIQFSMSSNYKGILWNRLESRRKSKQKYEKPQERQSYEYPTYTSEELEEMGSL